VWNGIDLMYTATAGSIYTTTYTLAPGADSSQIRLRYNAPLALTKDGTLRIAFETGTLTESAPIAWQDINGKRTAVNVAFDVHGQDVGFTLGAYNPHHTLTIDPTLAWHTFLGGSGSDTGTAIAVDGSGNVYVSGVSTATWGSPVQAYNGGSTDAFVTKLDSSGNLVWQTFVGGIGSDQATEIAVDSSGNVYLAGDSTATWGSPVQAYSTGFDAFAAKLDPSTGSVTWNTFMGGSGVDRGTALAVDGDGNAYVAGQSSATWGSPVRTYSAGDDVFAVKLNASTGSLTWQTFLGTTGNDTAFDIAVDEGGINPLPVVLGVSNGAWGCSPTACTMRAYNGAGNDVFVAKLNSSGALTWNTFLGGTGIDQAGGIAVDTISGGIYVAGSSSTTWDSPVRAHSGGFDAFVTRLSSSGNLNWNTFLGSSSIDHGNAITVDSSANVFVAGESSAAWDCSPTTCTARAYTADNDAFVAGLDVSGDLIWNTFLGGSGSEDGNAIAIDGTGNVYVAGNSSATWGSPVRPYTATIDAFAAKLGPPVVISSMRAGASPTNATSVDFTVTFSEPVTGVDTADFSLTTTGVSGMFVTGVSGSGATYTVSVNTGSGNGTIRLNVLDNDTIQNLAGKPLASGFASGEIYTIDKSITLTLTSIGAQDGWVLESSETSGIGGSINSTLTTFRLGDDAAKKQYRGILSFNTSSIPDNAVITAVTLKVKKQGVIGGGNPVAAFQGFMADIKKGLFGTSALQATDFQATFTAATGKTVGPSIPTPVSNVYSINLTSGKAYINKLSTNGGLTQIRLRFKLDDNNNTLANYLSLYSGNVAAASRPKLVITYVIP
jgi:hypothetical protein